MKNELVNCGNADEIKVPRFAVFNPDTDKFDIIKPALSKENSKTSSEMISGSASSEDKALEANKLDVAIRIKPLQDEPRARTALRNCTIVEKVVFASFVIGSLAIACRYFSSTFTREFIGELLKDRESDGISMFM